MPYLHCSRWVLAYSGGMDSHVLFHLLAGVHRQLSEPKPELLALHINHGLQLEAESWQQHCELEAKKLNTPFSSVRVDLSADGEAAGHEHLGNLEERARNARYGVFESKLCEGDLLLLAHHLDDQLETFMQRLLRGSGVSGLTAMPRERSLGKAVLLRPLLGVSRADLKVYAQKNKLCWVEDSSNVDERFDRNYLRHSIMPLIESRWPAYRTTLNRAVSHIAEADGLLKELAIADLPQLKAGAYPWGGYSISCEGLNSLAADHQCNALRFWMNSCAMPSPCAEHLVDIIAFASLAADSQPLLRLGDIEVRRYRDALVFMPCLAEVDLSKSYAIAAGDTLNVEGLGRLSLPRSNQGERVKVIGDLTLRFRQGGERCQPAARAHSQSLKKLLQEYQVPPWLRDRVPLLYSGDTLIAVADLWVCKAYSAPSNEPGYQLQWAYPTACFH